IAPLGPVYQAGTLSGNPIAMAAGLKTLELVSEPGFFEALEAKLEKLLGSVREIAKEESIAFHADSRGGMFGLFFTEAETVNCFEHVMDCNAERFKMFFHAMLKQNIYMAPSAFEAGFISAAHSDDDCDRTLTTIREAFKQLV
ncbi:MAG: aspartate aminotransferase family protein, partial [Arenicella sp.]